MKVRRTFRVRATRHPRSVDLEAPVKQQSRVKLGSELSEIGRRLNLSKEEFAIFESAQEHVKGDSKQMSNQRAGA